MPSWEVDRFFAPLPFRGTRVDPAPPPDIEARRPLGLYKRARVMSAPGHQRSFDQLFGEDAKGESPVGATHLCIWGRKPG